MARILFNFGGGSGDGSDDCTAKTDDVLAGKKAITSDSDDEVIEGTMLDNSGITQDAKVTLGEQTVQMIVPKTGKYTTTSKLCAAYATVAQLIGLTAAKLWPGVTILGITSEKQSISGGTYKPGTAQQTIACAGKVVNEDVIIAACSLPAASNIKKGVKVSLPSGESVTGTWEGFVAGDGIIYNQGTIGLGGGFETIPDITREENDDATTYRYAAGTLHYDTGMMRIEGYTMSARTKNPVDLSAYKTLNIKFISNEGGSTFGLACSYARPVSMNSAKDAIVRKTIYSTKETTITLDISEIQAECYVAFGGILDANGDGRLTVYEVWLS